MTKIIFLNGPPSSGKDTSAQLLREICPAVKRFAFADILKKMFCAALGLPPFPEGKDKDKPMPPPYESKTWRQGVIAFSEEFMKPLFGEDIFGKLLLEEILNYEHDFHRKQIQTGLELLALNKAMFPAKLVIAVTDSGFAKEGQVLTNHFGRKACCIVQLHRPGCDFSNDSRSYLTNFDIGADFTLYLHNDGDLAFLQSELGALKRWMETGI